MTTEAKSNEEKEQDQVITHQLGPRGQENMVILKYGPQLLDELQGLSEGNHLFEAVVVDTTRSGYLFPAEILVEARKLVDNLLEIRGALMFLKADSAIAIVKESLTSPPSFRVFNSYSEIFDYSPAVTKLIKSTLGAEAGFEEEGSDLAQQVLMSSTPILTAAGLDRKTNLVESNKINKVLSLIDNYSPLASILARSKAKLSEDEFLEILRDMEQENLIFPVFAKVPFLVKCFKNQSAFSLEEYFAGCKMLNAAQIDELQLELQSTKLKERMNFGSLAVKRGMISARALEVALEDQAFYSQSDDSKFSASSAATAEESKVQSLVGHLGSTDPMSLLQNMATNRESGILSVEYRDMQFKAHFDLGRPAHARIGKLHGDKAVIEFASAWKQGIFVFIKREPSSDLLKDTCKLNKPLDKLLLDAALAQDNTEVVWRKLPLGPDTPLEKDEEEKSKLDGELKEPREGQVLTKDQKELAKRVWNALDGLMSVSRVIKSLGDVTTSDAAFVIDVMLEYGLVKVPEGNMEDALAKFQKLAIDIKEHIGNERNSAFLRLSFRDTLGYSGRARCFILSPKCEIGVDMSSARRAETSLTQVLSDIENWQVKYIEYVSQDLDRSTLLDIIRGAHEGL